MGRFALLSSKWVKFVGTVLEVNPKEEEPAGS